MSINCNSDNSITVLGNGLGCGESTVIVCLSISTSVLKLLKTHSKVIIQKNVFFILLTRKQNQPN